MAARFSPHLIHPQRRPVPEPHRLISSLLGFHARFVCGIRFEHGSDRVDRHRPPASHSEPRFAPRRSALTQGIEDRRPAEKRGMSTFRGRLIMAQMPNAITVPTATSTLEPTLASHLARQAALVVAASVFVAICAHISIPLVFTPVPLTMQNFAVLLLGLLMEPVPVFAALTLYLIEGASGLPVFTPHGPAGLLHLLGPSGGYLLSYPFVAALVSVLARRIRPASFTTYALSAAA